MNKKNLLPCFALMIAIIPSNNTYVVSAEVNECISNADINLITAQHVLTNYGTDVSPLNIIPLYDIEDNLIAYNVNLDNGAYLIINSNKNNPIITEFGETQYISPSNSKQYYINPLIVESDLNSLNDSKIRTSSENDNPFYNFLKSNNSNKKTEYENLKEKIYSNTSYNLTSSMTKEVDNDDYDFFLYSADLKPTAYSETYINYANSLVAKWKNMTTFATLNDVHDHCAATSAYNLIYYYKYINNDTLPITTSEIHQLFLDIHDYIGNGPVIPLQFRNRLKDYLEDETDYNYTISASASAIWSRISRPIVP